MLVDPLFISSFISTNGHKFIMYIENFHIPIEVVVLHRRKYSDPSFHPKLGAYTQDSKAWVVVW